MAVKSIKTGRAALDSIRRSAQKRRSKLENIRYIPERNNLKAEAKDTFTKRHVSSSDGATFQCGGSFIDLYSC